ncbi:hypothetical protein C2I18_17790 [Paenibacillus sp. PK3_47]|uniref:hypothetical protein n=1 Tax=Paenibacillus sp. PK3_47 TaxID=2072642 RepID=UPI00201E32B1|nr:hypothetical protein [Paenibacillus sp. PK3_47]UQZ35207.1 hypothetical protein C2I18_17790 [Paenibacillus sp. PK3_47]
MPLSISSSLVHALNALPHNALVIDSCGSILFVSDSWKECCRCCELYSALDRTGNHYLSLFEDLAVNPVQLITLGDALQEILQGERLTVSLEIILQPPGKIPRMFRAESFPLITGDSAAERLTVLCLQHAGPVLNHHQLHSIHGSRALRLRHKSEPLVPICASCKSIRNSKEEWITIERFLKQQLSLQFTHDICPECIRQLYPKYAGALNR